MPLGSQEGLNINEANVLRDGAKTIGIEENANNGDVLGFGPNGDLKVQAGGGSGSGAVRWLGPCKVNAFAGQFLRVSPGGVAGGTFKLSLAGHQTEDILWDATPSEIAAAVGALPGLTPESVVPDPSRGQGNSIDEQFNLVFKDLAAGELMIGDGSGLTGPNAPYAVEVKGAEEWLIEMFTPIAGDIIEDFIHVTPADWDDVPKLAYIDAAAIPHPDSNEGPGWVVPSSAQGLDGLEFGSGTDDFDNLFGFAGDPADAEQATPLLGLIANWIRSDPHHFYTNLPAVVRHAVPIYSRFYNVSAAPTGGEVWIWVKVSTPAPLMD